MLKITNANKPITINQLVMVLYSLPGLGKTTLSFTAAEPLLLDFDKGAYRAKNRKDVVEIDSWADVAGMTKDDLAPYKTVIVDTAGRCLDVLTAHIIDENPKNARGSGDLTLQGYGVLKGKFISWLKLMRSYGKDVILISHMDEKQEGDIVKERLDVQGGSKAEIYKSADAIAKLYIDGKLRKLDFSPREGSLGKNPGQFEILTVADYQAKPLWLAGVVQGIKDSINKMSEDQQAEVKAIQDWKDYFHGCKSAKEFNDAMQLVVDRKASEVIKAMLWAKAKESGVKFDREAMQFYTPSVPQDEKQGTEAQGKPTDAPGSHVEGKKSALKEQLQGSLAVTPSPANTAAAAAESDAAETSDPSITRVTAKVTDAELRKNGKKEYVLATFNWMEGDFPIECPVCVWHRTLHDVMLGSLGKTIDVTIKRNVKESGTPNEVTFYSLEVLHSVDGEPFIPPTKEKQ